jgi:hypothetical protein
MSTVFISYRQTHDTERQRVRAFGERLRVCGVDVVLDQFLLDANPAGPNDGWDKWSSDRALHTELAYALVVENGYKKHDRFPVLDAAWRTYVLHAKGNELR